MRKILHVRTLPGYRLDLRFDDGVCGTVDLSGLAGRGIFAAWNDTHVFQQVRIGPSGDLVWNNQIDLCPDALYLKMTGKTPEQAFPSLRNDPIHA